MSVLTRVGEPLLRRERLAGFRHPAPTPPPASLSRMTTFAVANQKGGVGKTTTAVNLAACIAGAGMPTLLIDLDPQCNATVSLGQPRTLRPNAYDVLCQACTAAEAVHETPVDLLSLIPAGPGLVGATALGDTALEAETLSKLALLSGPDGARRVLAPRGGLIVHDDGEVEAIGAIADQWATRRPQAV